MYQTVIWKQQMGCGMEYCTFICDPVISIRGTVIMKQKDDNWLIQYGVNSDKNGVTQDVNVKFQNGDGERIIQINRHEDGQWFSNGHSLPACAGLSFIGIGVTPASNSLQ